MKKPAATVICSWCKEAASRKWLNKHLMQACPKFPGLGPNEAVCTHCQTIKASSEFPKSRGGKHWCKECGLTKFRDWKRKIRSGEIVAAPTSHIRPGRWVLKPCKYCGEMFNFQQGLYHRSRCEKRPPTAKSLITDYPDATIIPDMAAVRDKYLATSSSRLQRHRNLQFAYGITIEEYEKMLASQGGKCAICKATDSSSNRGDKGWLHVDHDHITGKIRALLCTRCNHLLGNCQDNIGLLLKAIEYLTRYQSIAEVS